MTRSNTSAAENFTATGPVNNQIFEDEAGAVKIVYELEFA